MRHEGDRITVFFEREGYKTLGRDLIAGAGPAAPGLTGRRPGQRRGRTDARAARGGTVR